MINPKGKVNGYVVFKYLSTLQIFYLVDLSAKENKNIKIS
jgi:hypothetical protein